MLGAVWVCECDLDPRGADQLVAHLDPELRFRGRGVCGQRDFSGEESVAGCQCDGGESGEGTGVGDGAAACWVGDCHQVSFLRVSCPPVVG